MIALFRFAISSTCLIMKALAARSSCKSFLLVCQEISYVLSIPCSTAWAWKGWSAGIVVVNELKKSKEARRGSCNVFSLFYRKSLVHFRLHKRQINLTLFAGKDSKKQCSSNTIHCKWQGGLVQSCVEELAMTAINTKLPEKSNLCEITCYIYISFFLWERVFDVRQYNTTSSKSTFW